MKCINAIRKDLVMSRIVLPVCNRVRVAYAPHALSQWMLLERFAREPAPRPSCPELHCSNHCTRHHALSQWMLLERAAREPAASFMPGTPL